MQINLVTTNVMKFQISKAYFDKIDGEYELTQSSIETPEIQDVSVENIALGSAQWAAAETGKPCITSDVGCFINSLNGFPGPFIKYINGWLTQADYLNLLKGRVDRSAYFEDALAIAYPDGKSKVFTRRVYGSISGDSDPNAQRSAMDALFIPNGYSYTLGKMTDQEQVEFWGNGNWPEMVAYLEQQAASLNHI